MEGTKAMDVTSQDARTSSDTVTVVVQGLARSGSNGQVGKDGAQTETLQLPRDAPITAIWDALASMSGNPRSVPSFTVGERGHHTAKLTMLIIASSTGIRPARQDLRVRFSRPVPCMDERHEEKVLSPI